MYTGVTQRLKQKDPVEVIHHLDKAVRESFIQSMTDPSCVALNIFSRAVAQQGDITHYRPHEITVCVYTPCGLTLKLISAVYARAFLQVFFSKCTHTILEYFMNISQYFVFLQYKLQYEKIKLAIFGKK